MAKDRVQPLKLEGADTGGVETDPYPSALDRNEDFCDARGYCCQNDTSNDDTVGTSRDASDNLILFDPVTGSKTLAELGTGISEVTHKTLRQLIHLADGGGPFEGFATGAYRETTGTVFPTAIVWYDKSGVGKKKIVEKLISYTGAFPTTITWKVYDATETLLATVTDTITYSGPFETSRTRAIA